MILLKFGIRCLTHFCVPLTLGLLAWNASWHGTSLQKLTKSSTESAKNDNLAASQQADRSANESTADVDRPVGDRSHPESIAMRQAGAEPVDRGLAIPRADDKNRDETAKADTDAASASKPVHSDAGSRGAPRDRDIDATGLERSVAEIKAAPEADSASVCPELAEKAGSLTSSGNSVADAERVLPESSVAQPLAASEDRAEDPHRERSPEPADLKPEVRAIAAEVPRAESQSQPEDKKLAQSASPAPSTDTVEAQKSQGSKTIANAVRPPGVDVDPPAADLPGKIAAANVDSKPAPSTRDVMSDSKANVGHSPEKLPDIVVAQDGDTWSRIAARVYGEEKMAEAIWKENLDAHGGSSQSLPIAGRLVRLPSSSPRRGSPNDGTQLARTAP